MISRDSNRESLSFALSWNNETMIGHLGLEHLIRMLYLSVPRVVSLQWNLLVKLTLLANTINNLRLLRRTNCKIAYYITIITSFIRLTTGWINWTRYDEVNELITIFTSSLHFLLKCSLTRSTKFNVSNIIVGGQLVVILFTSLSTAHLHRCEN